MMWRYAVVAVLSYVVGSFPTAYLLARGLRGIDIRHYGTGTVGGTNVGNQVGAWATVVVGLIDIAKGALPPLAARALGLGLGAVCLAGLAVVAGHDWSLFLSLKGGRGMAATLGCLLVLAPWATVVVLSSLFLGRAVRLTAFVNGIGVALLPLVALLLGEPGAIVFFCLALAGLIALKRLLANGEPYPATVPPARVRLNRLLFDRDVGPRESWGLPGRRPE